MNSFHHPRRAADRLAARAAGFLCHIQVVKEQAGAHSLSREIGCHKNKKPGDLAAHPGFEE